jgi:hypothetical protein
MRTPGALFGVRRQSVGLNRTNSGLSSIPHNSATGALPLASSSNDSAQQSQSPVIHQASTVRSATVHATTVPSTSPSGTQSAPPLAAQPLMMKESSNWHSSSVSGSNHWDINANAAASLHPAIRAHYAAMLQSQNVKVESQSDAGSTIQPLAMIPPLPMVSSTPSNPVAPHTLPASGFPSASPINQPVSRQPIQTAICPHLIQYITKHSYVCQFSQGDADRTKADIHPRTTAMGGLTKIAGTSSTGDSAVASTHSYIFKSEFDPDDA